MTPLVEAMRVCLPIPGVPVATPPPAVRSESGARTRFSLSPALSREIELLSECEQVPPFRTLLAAFTVLLHRYSGEHDILIWSPLDVARGGIDAATAMFGTRSAFMPPLSSDPTFRELLAYVGGRSTDATRNRDASMEVMAQARLARARQHPGVHVAFAVRNTRCEDHPFADPLSASGGDRQAADFALSVSIEQGADGLNATVQHDTTFFDQSTVARMWGHYETLLHAVVRDPRQRVSTMRLLTTGERRQLAVWNDTAAAYPETCIQRLFEQQVERTPYAVAAMFGGDQLTYRELNIRANQLARHLRAGGVGPETIVGISVQRSLDMLVGLLGILKAGAGYVPIDPAYPPAHLASIVEDSGAPVILTQRRLVDRLPAGPRVIRLDADRHLFEREDPHNPPAVGTPDSMAYVMYTSGSTGRPKGVVGLHRGAVNRFAWMWNAYPFAAGEVCCQKTSLNFVDSVSEIFVPLLKGVPIVILPDEVVKDPPRLVDTLAEWKVTRLVLVPSLLRDVLEVDGDLQQRLASLRICVSSGEALSNTLCGLFRERLPNAILLNLYGSTEVAADVTAYAIDGREPGLATIPIGRPIANTQIYLLDSHLQRVALGVPGELFVAGAGLARGYLNRPDITAERFIQAPWSADPKDRLYRTGDRARFLPDGNIEFLGRLDHQVKSRGFRVELGEVESVLAQHPSLRQAVVVARQEAAAGTRLVAYVVPRERPTPPLADLRTFCKSRLPEHMVPSAFVPLDGLPLTPSGKIDRRALPEPDRVRRPFGQAFVAPRTPVEERLAAIWRELLGLKQVGAHDDFFELGGHSLLAARLFTEIEKVFGRRLAVGTIVSAPTIAQIAGLLMRREEPAPWSPLVELQADGFLPPLFLIHGIGGEVLSFTTLAHHLAPDQPVYGIRARGSDDLQEPLTDIESMAAEYLAAIRSVAPEGPYYLAGYSSGGTLALEMAQQLRAQGEVVALLAMIDSEAPESYPGERQWRVGHLPAFVANVARWAVQDDFFRSGPRFMLANIRSKMRMVRAKLMPAKRQQAPPDIRDVLRVWQFPEKHRPFLEAHHRALTNYKPKPYPGPVTLLRAGTMPLFSPPDNDLGWSRLASGRLEIKVIPGAHDNILTEPRVSELAEQLRTCLRESTAMIPDVAKMLGVVAVMM